MHAKAHPAPDPTPAAAAILTDADRDALRLAIEQVNTLLLGKQAQVELAFACLLAGGHLLVEDLPGLGKTTLARSMAATVGLGFQRTQFTADLLPSDIIGVSIFDQELRSFCFHPGALFTQLLLADEINRAPPRTQSALLEAMAEQQVTVDGQRHALPSPFFVIATQNPVDLAGTFPLPDSQLDRFLMRITLGYPDPDAERAMLAGSDRQELIADTRPLLDPGHVLALRSAASGLHASERLVDYIQRLVSESRRHPGVRVGLSPRAGLALLRAARALALLRGAAYVLPEHVQGVFNEVAAHRLVPDGEAAGRDALAQSILRAVRVD